MKIVNPIGRIIEDEAADYSIPYACYGTTIAMKQASCSSCGCGCSSTGTASVNTETGVRNNAKYI